MTPHPLPKTLFVGKAGSGVCWYRCTLPAMALGLDWVSLLGDPPHVAMRTGVTSSPVSFDDLSDYDVVVLSQPFAEGWRRTIRALRDAGTTVLFETDDYVHAVSKIDSHELQGYFTKELLRSAELNMRLADGVICSTPYIARQYRAFNRRVWVCRNGLDLPRYDPQPPPRTGVTIGWAGGIGHDEAVRRWLPTVAEVLRLRPEARFVTVGAPFARLLEQEFGPERCQSVPGAPLEMYPAAMTRFDITIAPAAHNKLYRGKSDLRWMESSALGIPVVCDPYTYGDVEDGVTGFHARSLDELRSTLLTLIDEPELRRHVGEAARDEVRAHRRAEVAAEQWAEVLREVAELRAYSAVA